jgi:hypothetical protein
MAIDGSVTILAFLPDRDKKACLQASGRECADFHRAELGGENEGRVGVRSTVVARMRGYLLPGRAVRQPCLRKGAPDSSGQAHYGSMRRLLFARASLSCLARLHQPVI